MEKQNCWEFKQCGREAGGAKVGELGVCPAATDASYDGLNGGKNAGRSCWAATGTYCAGEVQGTFAEKLPSCQLCSFMHKVKDEESVMFIMYKSGKRWFDRHSKTRLPVEGE